MAEAHPFAFSRGSLPMVVERQDRPPDLPTQATCSILSPLRTNHLFQTASAMRSPPKSASTILTLDIDPDAGTRGRLCSSRKRETKRGRIMPRRSCKHVPSSPLPSSEHRQTHRKPQTHRYLSFFVATPNGSHEFGEPLHLILEQPHLEQPHLMAFTRKSQRVIWIVPCWPRLSHFVSSDVLFKRSTPGYLLDNNQKIKVLQLMMKALDMMDVVATSECREMREGFALHDWPKDFDASDCRNLRDVSMDNEGSPENTVTTSETKFKTQKAHVTRHQKEVEQLRTKLNETEAAREGVASDLEQLRSSSSSLSADIRTLRSQIETLEASNYDALTLVGSTQENKDRVAGELSEQLSKLLALRREVDQSLWRTSSAQSRPCCTRSQSAYPGDSEARPSNAIESEISGHGQISPAAILQRRHSQIQGSSHLLAFPQLPKSCSRMST